MYNTPTLAVLLATPIYVLLSFTSHALTPWWHGLTREAPAVQPLTLAFVGDMMFDRYIRERAEATSYGAILSPVASLLKAHDMVFGNLEGPITTFTPVSDYRDAGPNHYKFTFATTVAQTLEDTHFGAVTLGNNHITNFGAEGVTQTKQWLAEAGVGYIGAPDEPYGAWRVATSGHELAFYAYDPWHNKDLDTLIELIGTEATSTFVVVLAHWGEEYETEPTDYQIERGHALVDAGADLIVGSHPHVVQSKEQYEDTWIYYSLGNFVFDQYFSSEVRCGALLSVTLNETGQASTTEHFIRLEKDGTTATSTCMAAVPMLD